MKLEKLACDIGAVKHSIPNYSNKHARNELNARQANLMILQALYKRSKLTLMRMELAPQLESKPMEEGKLLLHTSFTHTLQAHKKIHCIH